MKEGTGEGQRAAKENACGQNAEHGDFAGSPGNKRQVVERFVSRGRCSMQEACRYFRLHHSTYTYEGSTLMLG